MIHSRSYLFTLGTTYPYIHLLFRKLGILSASSISSIAPPFWCLKGSTNILEQDSATSLSKGFHNISPYKDPLKFFYNSFLKFTFSPSLTNTNPYLPNHIRLLSFYQRLNPKLLSFSPFRSTVAFKVQDSSSILHTLDMDIAPNVHLISRWKCSYTK